MNQQSMTHAGPPEQQRIEQLLKASDIARRLSISRSAAYKLMAETLPVVRFGANILRVRESDLEEFIASRVDRHENKNSKP